MSEGTFAYRELQRADRERREVADTDLTPRPVKYTVRIEGKTVIIEPKDGGWIARRGDHYVTQDGWWMYKSYGVWKSPDAAARMANAAPRSGSDIRAGWWADNAW